MANVDRGADGRGDGGIQDRVGNEMGGTQVSAKSMRCDITRSFNLSVSGSLN